MPEQHLTDNDRSFLLSLARQSIDNYLNNTALPLVEFGILSPILKEQGASFVTLTYRGYLRGCVGALDAYQSLAEDVREHAIAAAFQDYRFPPVQAKEMKDIEIEISYLTQPTPLSYENPNELLEKLRPNIDGVVIQDGMRRATFLPQVWEKIPDPAEFLDQLCMKMGAPADLWRKKKLEIKTYQVEEFHE
ncbi:MAG: AmmeMemoRadiSam system protein A [Anaerolineales bacterium]